MSFSTVTDAELLSKLKILVSQERELTILILRHLEEVERRRLYSPKYASLFEYVTLELGYSAASAQRRIASMRTLRVLPEVEEKVSSGAITLSNLAQAAKYFQNEAKNANPLSHVEKLAIIKQLENKSTRGAEKELAARSSNPQVFLNKESIKPVTENFSKITFVAEQALIEDLEKIKSLLSHQFPHLTTAELIAEMAKVTLAKLESDKFAKRKNEKKLKATETGARQTGTKEVGLKETEAKETWEIKENSGLTFRAGSRTTAEQSRYISAEVKRAVYARDGLQCTFIDSSGRRCTSRHQLEFDHAQVPFAFGGKNDEQNLRIRCRAHNLWSATQKFGEKTKVHLKDYLERIPF